MSPEGGLLPKGGMERIRRGDEGESLEIIKNSLKVTMKPEPYYTIALCS